MKATILQRYRDELEVSLTSFQKETKFIRRQYYDMVARTDKVDEIIRKLTRKVLEYE